MYSVWDVTRGQKKKNNNRKEKFITHKFTKQKEMITGAVRSFGRGRHCTVYNNTESIPDMRIECSIDVCRIVDDPRYEKLQ